MEPKDLLLKEYDSAWQHLILAKESKQKTIRLFLGLIAGLAAFLVKGDLPLKSLAYLPIIEIIFLVYVINQIYAQTCASNSFHVVEEKINQHIKDSETLNYKFDLTHRTRYLRNGDGRYMMGLISRIILIISLLASSIISLHMGLIEYAVTGWKYWVLMSSNAIVIVFVGLVHHYEVRGRKQRHKEIVTSIKEINEQNT